MSPQTNTTQKFLADARSIRERVDGLEQVIPALVKNVGKGIDELKSKTDFMAEWMDALVGVVGVDLVQAAVLDARQKKAAAQMEADKADLAAQKAAGTLVPLEKVEDECFVVLTEVKNDTTEPVGAGWFRLHTTQLKPEFKALLKDKAPGYSERREESTFTLVEVLKYVPPPPAPAAEAAPTVEA